MLNMLGKCPQCSKPTVSKGMSCDSCIGEAHRTRPKRRAKTVSRADSSVYADRAPSSIIVEVDGVPTELECEDPRTLPIVEPPVYSSKPPVEAVPAASMVRNENGGLKYSKHKPRPSLVPVLPFWELVKVLTFGAAKYTRDGIDGSDNWKKNEPSQYIDALERHIAEWKMGRKVDPESGLHPLAHAAASLFFLLWFELTGRDQ